MNVRCLAVICLALAWPLLAAAETPAPSATAKPAANTNARPNIILLVADDLGYCDLSSFGSPAVKTPYLDQLAAEGVKLTHFYTTAAVCSPTRASILTGRYPARLGIFQHFIDKDRWLDTKTTTIAELLHEAGYATAHVGKWHLGGLHVKDGVRTTNQPGPRQHGFDEYQCQIEQQPLRGRMGKERTLYRKGGTCLIQDDQQVGPESPDFGKHLTDAQADYAIEVIKKNATAGKPFFLNLWWLVPHTPYEPAPEPHWTATNVPAISDDQHRFRSMVQHMDARVGDILHTLEELKIADNTLVIFTSDNGAAFEGNIGTLAGGKGVLHEGGLRVPFIARWAGHVKPGTTLTEFGNSTDILPTICAAAGVSVPQNLPLDGKNLWPSLTGGAELTWDDRGTAFWAMNVLGLQRHYPKPAPVADGVARRGSWKLMLLKGNPVGLFDVAQDPDEKTNRLAENSDVAEKLAAEWRAWRKGNPAAPATADKDGEP